MAESATASTAGCPGSDILRRLEWRWLFRDCYDWRRSLFREGSEESAEETCGQLSGGINERPEYHTRPSKSARARHVPLPRIRGRVRHLGISGVYQRLRTVLAQRGGRG